MISTNKHGFAWLPVLIVLAVIGGGAWGAKKFVFTNEKKLAKDSKEATQKVDATINQVDAAQQKQAASAAASVQAIAEANSVAPESPSKDFIGREVEVALAYLPKPDLAAFAAAQLRKNAVLEGNIQETQRLYGEARNDIAKANSERDAAIKARDAAMAERRAVDGRVQELADELAASSFRSWIWISLALLATVLWLFSRFSGLNYKSLGKFAADVKAGVDPIIALDTHTAPWLHSWIKKHAKIHAVENENAARTTSLQ